MSIQRHSLEAVTMVPVPGGRIEARQYVPHAALAASRVPLIVTHGGPGGSSIGLYDALHPVANHRPVIFYDQLGSHGSPATLRSDQMTLERFAEEPLHLMNALQLDRAALLGHSWGGSVVCKFAIDHPERVHALVLSSPLLSTERWIADCQALVQVIPSEEREREGLDNAFNRRHFCRTNPLPPTLERERARFNTTLYQQMWGPSEFEHKGRLGDLDLFPHLASLLAPTLLLCGEHDTATPHTMEAASSTIGENASTAVLANAGHKTYIDQTKHYIAAVTSFLADSESSPASNDNADHKKRTHEGPFT